MTQTDSKPVLTHAPSGRLWTAKDLADYLTVPLATLYQWRYQGIGPTAYRVGRYLRYEPAAIQTWLEQQAQQQEHDHGKH